MFKVLIVDNDRPMCQALDQLVTKHDGFEVVETISSGESALQICRQQPVDIIFMNTILSGMSGMETSEKILRKYPTVSIYLMSNYIRKPEFKRYLEDLANGFLQKPLNLSAVTHILEDYKAQHKGDWQGQLIELIGILQDRDYTRMYHDISKIVECLYEPIAFVGEGELAKELLKMGEALFETMYFYDEGKSCLKELFPLNEALISEKSISELWLFRVMDYIFEQNSINRYPLLKQVFEYINEHIKEDITLNTIVEKCAVSQGYLSRIFKSQFNTSVMEYLHMRKMSLAKGYFCFTEYTIAEVAFKLGYNESSYFSKVFKKYEHMTGKEYRNRIQHQV